MAVEDTASRGFREQQLVLPVDGVERSKTELPVEGVAVEGDTANRRCRGVVDSGAAFGGVIC